MSVASELQIQISLSTALALYSFLELHRSIPCN